MIAGVWIVTIECKCIAVAEKVFQVRNRDRKSQSFSKTELHVDDTDDLPLVIEQRPATVPGIDLGRRLNVNDAVHVAIPRTHDAF